MGKEKEFFGFELLGFGSGLFEFPEEVVEDGGLMRGDQGVNLTEDLLILPNC